MLIGEPGTGKTLMIYNLIKNYLKTHHIGYVQNFKELIYNIENISRYSLPSILIFEDCESEFKKVNNYILNFLDGIYQPKVKKGVYIIFTTNSPVGVEDRIMKRPGRIDRIIHVGTLKHEEALRCAQYYFKDFFDITEEYQDVFHNLTGAQIANMVNGVKSRALDVENIDKKLFIQVKNDMIRTWQEADKYAYRNYDKRSVKGFFPEEDETPF